MTYDEAMTMLAQHPEGTYILEYVYLDEWRIITLRGAVMRGFLSRDMVIDRLWQF